MAAFEATGERIYLDRAESIADLIIGRHAAALGWRVAEHFDEDWWLDRDYRGRRDVPPGRARRRATGSNGRACCCSSGRSASGATTGCPMRPRPLPAGDRRSAGTRSSGGFFYTLDWDNRPAAAREALVARARKASAPPRS